MRYVLESTMALSGLFSYDCQPYGPIQLEDCRVETGKQIATYSGETSGEFRILVGRAVSDSKRYSYLGACRSEHSCAGQSFTVYGIKDRELQAMSAVRIAM